MSYSDFYNYDRNTTDDAFTRVGPQPSFTNVPPLTICANRVDKWRNEGGGPGSTPTHPPCPLARVIIVN